MILAVLLVTAYATQCLWFVGTQSFTVDEPFNLAVGIQRWRGMRNVGNDNPPLLRMLCALPLLRSPAVDVAASEFELDRPVDPIAVAWCTRPMNVVLGALLGIAVWTAARRRFSAGAANFALALFAFSPPLIAHFSIIGTDAIAALMIFITALQVARFRRDPSWRQALVTGIVLGLLLLAKLYTLPMYALALLLVVLPSPVHLRIRRWQWSKALVIVATSFVVLWACYGFHGSDVVLRGHRVWLPAGEFVQSIQFQLEHGREGHTAYLLGKVSEHGWHYYFPVAVALKWPTVVLVLALVAGVLALFRRIRLPRDFGVIFLFPVSFFVLAIFSTVNIGERYVLAVYPFVLLWVAGLYPTENPHPVPATSAGTRLWQAESPSGAKTPVDEEPASARLKPCPSTATLEGTSKWKGRVVLALLVCAVVLNAADALRFAPDYLSYFTVLVPQQQSWRYLSDSSLDWGQGLIALRKFEQQHPGEAIHVAYFTNGIGPDRYGLEAIPFGEQERPTGIVVVSPGVLSGQYNEEQEAYRWVLRYPVKAVIGHDFLVFDVPR